MVEKKFYKEVKINNPKSSYGTYEKIYLFKIYDEYSKDKPAWMSAYRDRNGDDFIVESGAGISESKMESQIMSYLKKKIKKEGFL
jgi:hypothetical protein